MKPLTSISTPQGVITAIAVDQRKSLRRMIAAAKGVVEGAIPDTTLTDFKRAVMAALSPHASAVLVDPEYGRAALADRAPSCGLLLTYEADGFDNPRPHRMLALMPDYSAVRLQELGAQGVKILLSWAPGGDSRANDEKRVMVERIGYECEGAGIPFLLEPVVYDPARSDPRGVEFARQKPELVRATIQEFSRPVYRVDVLKVEFPVVAAHLGTAYSRDEAVDAFRAIDAVAGCPYIYLSAGVSLDEFMLSLELACEAGAGHSGVLCGRAAWQDGIPIYAQHGRQALDEWLATQGVRNVGRIVEGLTGVRPWWKR
jgi:tagatose 1,6-diphosphate aldolase